MADIDTGLGWYAAEEWLSAAAEAVGSLAVPGVSEPDKRISCSTEVSLTTRIIETDAGYFTMKFTTHGNCPYFFAYKETESICQIYMMGPEAFHVRFIYESSGGGSLGTWEYDSTENWHGTGKYGFSFYTSEAGATCGSPNVFDESYTSAQIAAAMYDAVYVKDKVYLYSEPVDFLLNTFSGTYTRFEVTGNTAQVYYSVQMYYDTDSSRWRFVVALASAENFTARIVGGATFTISKPIWGQDMYGGGYYFAAQSASNYEFPGLLPYTESGFAAPYPGLYRAVQQAPASTVNYAKSGAGYSVVCMCKWRTDYDGPIYVSPVLISSEPNNTLYTRNSATPSVNNTEHQYQGKTFYMRKAPLDTLTEGAELSSTFPIVDLSGVAQTNDTIFLAIAYQSNLTVGQVDPYSGAGESEPGAEEATFDFDSTEIDFGTPPTVTAAGMVELYIPSTSDLASLAQYLWAGSFDPDNFKKLLADPMDAIIGLQIVPVTAAQIGTTPDTLYVGNISTDLSMPKASRQYVPVDCGSLSIPRRLGSYLDYSPHTEMQLYLPYVGFVDISPDDCMGGTVSVKYMVDIIGGTCVAQVKCNSHVLYEYAAACSCQVPVSAGQYQNIVLGAVRGGIGLASGILGAAGGGLFSGISEAADAALSMTKPKIQRSGGFGGSSGLMGHQTPYIIYTVPRLIVPGRQNNFIGYPSYITRTLGDLTGYTQIDSIHLTGIPASQAEQAEIEQLLQEGVYL